MQGLATEAAQAILELGFALLGLHRIYAETTTWNRRSWKLMERIGMRREAHFRESREDFLLPPPSETSNFLFEI